MYQAIDCDKYDYLEICCMRHYEVQLEMKDGRILNARPVDTLTRSDRTEWLNVQLMDGPISSLDIRLDQLSALTPHRACRAEFGRIEFSPAN